MRKEENEKNNGDENEILFTEDEMKLLKKYIGEYNDIYQKILILTPYDFIKKLIKHVELSLRSKKYKYSKKTKDKIQEFVKEKIYQPDYKYAEIIRKNIDKRNIYELSKNCFKGEIIPHCEHDKKNGFYIHSCGEKFQTFKYKLSCDYYLMNNDKEIKTKDINTNNYENILFCKKCNMIYKSSLIKFKCAQTNIDFYSKINIAKNENNDDLPFVTWSNYHCNAVINDLMKCQKCSNNLYLLKKMIKNIEKKFIFCKNCNQMWSPTQLMWDCLICKKKFTCDVKAYNPLEYKTLKICVKDALIDRIKAYPEYLDCKCNIDLSKTTFFHRTSCNGELFFGELNGKKTIICSECDSIGFYDGYIWTCPKCLKKTKCHIGDNKFEECKSIDEKIEKNKFENKSVINRRKIREIKDQKDNSSVSKISKNNKCRNRRFYNLFKNNINLKDIPTHSDLMNNISTNDYLKNKDKNESILFKDNGNDSMEKRNVKGNTEKKYNKTLEKYENEDEKNGQEIEHLKKNHNYSRNPKEAYFRNFKKRYATNLSINTKLNTNLNNSRNNTSLRKMNSHLGQLLSSISTTNQVNNNIQESEENKYYNEDINNNNEEKKVLNPKKSFSIIDFNYFNVNDKKDILNKYKRKININLKTSVMNYHRPSCKNIFNKEYITNQKKDKNKEKSFLKNKTSINDSITESSQIEKIKRKDSFITQFNKFKKTSNLTKYSTDKKINKSDVNRINNMVINNKNILDISNNAISDLIKKDLEKDEFSSLFKNDYEEYIRKSKIFNRFKNMNNNKNINNDNKDSSRIKINNEYITENNKERSIYDKINEEEKKSKESNLDNYYADYNKKGSNSTADSDYAQKIIYHGKNPKQSFRIKRPNANILKNNNNFNINDYKIVKKIGHGSFGQIFQIEDKYGDKFAMKKLILGSKSDIKKIEKEYQILIDLNLQIKKENAILDLVKIYGYSSKQLDPTTYVIYVIMELAITDWEKEILFRQKTKKYYTEKELMTILSSLINTFVELQKRNISHRDIKPQNILLFKDGKYKLSDFGEAKELFKDIAPTNKQTLRGTELYMAPALFHALRSKKMIKYINHNPYKSDVFSFGLCSLFAATLCFESIYDIRELNNNISIHVILEKYLRKNYSYDVINIISQMLDINETTRKDFIEMQREFKSIGYE